MITFALIMWIGGPAFFLGWLAGTLITSKIEGTRRKEELASNEKALQELTAKRDVLEARLLLAAKASDYLDRAVKR